MKGVILAGGTGSRLQPLTSVVGKQLLPVYDKPMIYYPLSTLILAGIDEVLIIVNPHELAIFESVLGNGSKFGISIKYKIQLRPSGLADGVGLAREFVGSDTNFMFILGDNLFFGPAFGTNLENLFEKDGATIFSYRVANPREYGVVEYDKDGEIQGLVEKPKQPMSNWAIPGIYVLDQLVFEFLPNLKPSPRGELEIIDLLTAYLNAGKLFSVKSSRGNAWFDLGTPDSILSASVFISNLQSRQGMLVGSPEESALVKGKLSARELSNLVEHLPDCSYRNALREVLAFHVSQS